MFGHFPETFSFGKLYVDYIFIYVIILSRYMEKSSSLSTTKNAILYFIYIFYISNTTIHKTHNPFFFSSIYLLYYILPAIVCPFGICRTT